MVQLAGQQREHLRPPRIGVREGFRCRLERLNALAVDAPTLAGPSAAVREHRAAETVGVVELLRERCRVEQCLAKLRVSDLALGLPQADQQLAALAAIAAGRLAVELERLAIPARGLIGGELLKRALGGAPGVVDGLGRVAADHRCRPMAGELAQPLAWLIPALVLERLCDPPVQPGAARSPEILIQGVLDERMGEREAPRPSRALLSSDAATASSSRSSSRVSGSVDYREQQIEIEVTADHRGRTECRAGVRAQALHPPPDHLAHALGQAQLGEVSHHAPAPVFSCTIAPDSVR